MELLRSGRRIAPMLRDALKKGLSAEAAARVEALLSSLELGWPDPSRVPAWWKGAD